MGSLGGPKTSQCLRSFAAFLGMLLCAQGLLAQQRAHAEDVGDAFPLETICTNNASEAGKYGKRSCSVVLDSTKEVLSKSVKNIIGNYYDGKLIEPDFRDLPNSSGFCQTVDANKNAVPVRKPICNIADPQLPGGSKGTGGEDSANWNGETCVAGSVDPVSKGYCDFKSLGSGSKISMEKLCPKEMQWFQSVRPQVWQKVRYDLFKEVQDTGQVKLTKASDGAMPCQPFLAEVVHLMKGNTSDPQKPVAGLIALEEDLKHLAESGDPDFQFDPTQGCLKTDKTVKSQADIQASVDQLFENSSAGILEEKKRVSQSVCYLQYARIGAEFLFNRLLICEFKVRSDIAYLDMYTNSSAIFGELVDGILDGCKTYAYQKCEDSIPPGQSVWSNNCGRAAFYECYINGTGNSVSQNYGGVRGYFRKKIQEKVSFPAGEGLFPFEKIKDKNGTEPVLDKCALSIAPFGSLLSGLLKKIRRRRKVAKALKRGKAVTRTAWLVLGTTLALLMGPRAFAVLPKMTAELTCPDGTVIEVKPTDACANPVLISACKAGYDKLYSDEMAYFDQKIGETDTLILGCGSVPYNTYTSTVLGSTLPFDPICGSTDMDYCYNKTVENSGRLSDFIDSMHSWPASSCLVRVGGLAIQLVAKQIADTLMGPAMREAKCVAGLANSQESQIMAAIDVYSTGMQACLEDAMKTAGNGCPVPAQEPPPAGTMAMGNENGPPQPWTKAREALEEMLDKHKGRINAKTQQKDLKATAAYKSGVENTKSVTAGLGNGVGLGGDVKSNAGGGTSFGAPKTYGGSLQMVGASPDEESGSAKKKADLVYGNVPIGTGFDFSAAENAKNSKSARGPATTDGDVQLESANGSTFDANLQHQGEGKVNSEGLYDADESLFAVIHRRYGKVSPRFE